MSNQKPSIPKGMRDFGPEIMAKRNFILDAIKSTFIKFGFQPLETPTMEKLSVLTGKYGDEGDQLIFKVLDSGDFLSQTSVEDYNEGAKKILPKIAGKGLKYDLTVPFARYVVMNRHELTFPFKRFQIQPVWRADRPQKGRYREFYQCDADVVGTDSLICEAEIFVMINEVFSKLGITDFTIKFNNRKMLNGIAEIIGAADKVSELCVAIDKLDKIGVKGVEAELINKGFSTESIDLLNPVLQLEGDVKDRLNFIKGLLGKSAIGNTGINEVEEILTYLDDFKCQDAHLEFDPKLARGLSYYTGTILEVKVDNVSIGSVSGGGRYDDLTGVFGMPDISGVGFSFGVDRLYDVMEELNLFPNQSVYQTKAVIIPLSVEFNSYGLSLLTALRNNGINSEIYPDIVKLKKSMNYANKKQIPFVILIGEEEFNSGQITLKNMENGQQSKLTTQELIDLLK